MFTLPGLVLVQHERGEVVDDLHVAVDLDYFWALQLDRLEETFDGVAGQALDGVLHHVLDDGQELLEFGELLALLA